MNWGQILNPELSLSASAHWGKVDVTALTEGRRTVTRFHRPPDDDDPGLEAWYPKWLPGEQAERIAAGLKDGPKTLDELHQVVGRSRESLRAALQKGHKEGRYAIEGLRGHYRWSLA